MQKKKGYLIKVAIDVYENMFFKYSKLLADESGTTKYTADVFKVVIKKVF